MKLLDLLRDLWGHISRRRRAQLAGIFALTLLSTVAELASIGAVLPFLAALSAPESVLGNPLARQLLGMVGVQRDSQVVPALTVFFALAVVFAGVVRYLLMFAQTRLSFLIGADVGAEIYRRTLYQPYQVHLSRNSSEIISAITIKVRDVVNQAVGPSITLVSAVILLIGMGAFLFLIDPVVASLAFALFGSIYVLIAVSVKRRLLAHGSIMAEKQTEVVRALQEGLMGIRDVLLTGTQEIYLAAFRNADRPTRNATARIIILSQAPRYGIEAVGMVLVAVIAYLLVNVMGKAASALPILGALALGAQRMLPLLQQAYWSYSQLYGGMASLDDVLQLLNQPVPSELDRLSKIAFTRDIELRELEFSYGPDRPRVLHHVNFRISKGMRVGVVGETGSGKSTLIDIIMGLVAPTSGSLVVDGVAIGPRELRGWQQHISHVPQSIYLSDASVAENIAFGIPLAEIDWERVAAAARQAHISDVVESWKDGYRTEVGEQGVRLSGGQRQRIGIARALYRNADVLVLDEATSALDEETEKSVMDAVDQLSESLTIIMVAHRLTTLRQCDLIIQLSGGTVNWIGSHDELMLRDLRTVQ